MNRVPLRVEQPHTSDIEIAWRNLRLGDDPYWASQRCLYAYVAPDCQEILYIGKAWGCTVRERWNRAAKESFWDGLERERRIFHHMTLQGDLQLNYSGRLSSQLLLDVETLLINAVQPWGNKQAKTNRIRRPRMNVRCTGAWPRGDVLYIDAP